MRDTADSGDSITQSAKDLDSRGSWDTWPGAVVRLRACPGIRSARICSSRRVGPRQP